MEKTTEARFFLGANGPEGFASLYDSFTDPRKDTLYIVKGGPGSGKSTFMRLIGESVHGAGHPVEYIHCSGDPDSLDAVYFPDMGVGFVDGTAPHVTEPTYPGVTGYYINLGEFYKEGLTSERDAIIRLTGEYKSHYARAYKLVAASGLARDALMPSIGRETLEAVAKRAGSTAAREFKSAAAGGTVRRRFLSAVTCRGNISFYETAQALCERIYLLDNDLGLGTLAVEILAGDAESRGLAMIRCQSPLSPGHTEHLLLPELGLAFLTQSARFPYKGEAFRHIRLDAVPERNEQTAMKNAVKNASRYADALLDEAITELGRAKELHDRLEEAYNPYVRFDDVRALANRYAEKLTAS